MHRLFISPDWIKGNKVSFPPELARRLMGLGLRRGDHLIVLNNTGWEHEVALIEIGGGVALGQVVKKTLATGERRTKISLYQGLVPPEDFGEIVQLGTELGIVEFVPMACDRCEVPHLDTFDELMLNQWREMIISVAQATQRGRLPRVGPAVLFDAALDHATRYGRSLIIVEEEDSQNIQAVTEDNPFSIHLLAPPPDGFSSREVGRAVQRGAIPIRLPADSLSGMPAGLLISQAIFDQLG